jgi:hypothetical protein
MVTTWRADGRGCSVDLFQPVGSPLRQREMTMWMYLEPSCLDRPFFEELDDTKINTRIRGVLTHGTILDLGTSPAPLREGVDSLWVISLDPLSATCANIGLSTHAYSYAGSRVCS